MHGETTLVALMRAHAARHPDKPFASIWRSSGVTDIGYRQLWDRSGSIAAALRDRGVTAGDLVVISHELSLDLYAAFLGAMRIGAVPSLMPYPNAKQRDEVYWEGHRALYGHIEPRAFVLSGKIAGLYALNLPESVAITLRTDLIDDLDGEGERQLCALAEKELGVPAVFVLGFPLAARPFYTHPRGGAGAAQSFDLLFRGLEITTGGQRLHKRAALEAALRGKGIDPSSFAGHLRMFELGMPPHGGLAIGLERLTAQVLGLANVREATMYPRDRNRVEP
jgi:hypothetical protein